MIMVELFGFHLGEEVTSNSPTFRSVDEAKAFVDGLDPRQAYRWVPANPLPLPEEDPT